MLKRLKTGFFFLLALVSTFTTNAQQKSKEADRSLLWRISSKDMQRSSYLFGTIHLICPDDYIWTAAMKQSLEKCQEVCFELDLDDPAMMMQVATGMMNTDGKSLKDYFSESDYLKLSKYVTDSLGVSISMFQQMKPVALEALFTKSSGGACSAPVSYENNIMELAKEAKKEITGLESVSEQLDLFDNLPADSVVKDIMNTVNGVDNNKSDYQELVNAYKTQDLPELHKLIQVSGATDLDLSGFLDVRNEKWVPRMVEKMDKHSVFFAVGAGHLPGENGVINLLRKAGYVVTPIK